MLGGFCDQNLVAGENKWDGFRAQNLGAKSVPYFLPPGKISVAQCTKIWARFPAHLLGAGSASPFFESRPDSGRQARPTFLQS